MHFLSRAIVGGNDLNEEDEVFRHEGSSKGTISGVRKCQLEERNATTKINMWCIERKEPAGAELVWQVLTSAVHGCTFDMQEFPAVSNKLEKW